EKMPEFIGGLDSLTSYLKTTLHYPKWEKENKIEGTVYVSFVINKEGKIENPRILRSVKDSKNFDNEVLKIINEMPDWIPGEQDGKKVKVQYNLPIRFKL